MSHFECRVKLSNSDGIYSAHTQAVAYVIGETAAEKMIAEYLYS